MTDKELIDLAAQAVGITDKRWLEKDEGGGRVLRFTADGNRAWRPLENDGDALRLAVKLGIMINNDIESGVSEASTKFGVVDAFHGSDACASTRLVIVMAAAKMEQENDPTQTR